MTDVWGLRDYACVAERLAPVAEAVVEAAGVAPGQLIADVAAGTGNVARAAARRGATVTAMGSHLHLLVATPETDLGDGMKAVHERFARKLHERYVGHGHVFGARFHNKLVRTVEHEVACLRYIANNPVKAGLCTTAADWPWSAHRFLAGDERAPDHLDVEAALTAISRDGYCNLVALDDLTLLECLEAEHRESWVAHAVDDHHVGIEVIADHLGFDARPSTSGWRRRERRASRPSLPPARPGGARCGGSCP